MATLKLRVTTGINTATLVRDYERTVSAKYPTVQSIADLINSILAGCQRTPSVNVMVEESEGLATGTVTLASAQAADTVTLNGVVFTAVSGAAGANQFDISGGNTTGAASLAAAINASVSALVAGYVVASANGAVVTIASAFRGLPGNQVTLATSNGSRLAPSGTRLAGGTADANAKTYSF